MRLHTTRSISLGLVGVRRHSSLAQDQLCDTTSRVGALWASVDIQTGPSNTADPGSQRTHFVVDRRPLVQMCGKECNWAADACTAIIEEHAGDLADAIDSGREERDELVEKAGLPVLG